MLKYFLEGNEKMVIIAEIAPCIPLSGYFQYFSFLSLLFLLLSDLVKLEVSLSSIAKSL